MVLSAADVVRIVHTVLEWLLWWSALAPSSVHRLPALADRTTSLLRLSPLSLTALPNRSNCWRCQDALLPVASCEWPTPVDTMALPPYTFLVACMKAPGNSGALRCRHVVISSVPCCRPQFFSESIRQSLTSPPASSFRRTIRNICLKVERTVRYNGPNCQYKHPLQEVPRLP